MVNNEDVLMLIEDLGLIHSSFITPTVIELIEKQINMRQFDMPDYDRLQCELYLKKLLKFREEQRKLKPPPESPKQLRFNF